MRRLTLVLALLLVLAGCTGPASDVAGTETPTVTPAPTPTPPTATADEMPGAPANATAGNAVDYADLLPESQDAFDAAVQGGAKFLPESPYVGEEFFRTETAARFHDVEYVHKDGEYYAVDLYTSGEIYASYDIQATPASPGENATVVAYENLSERVSSEVRWAVENRSYHVPVGKWNSLPRELALTEFVRYDGETYRMSYIVGDYWVVVMKARPA